MRRYNLRYSATRRLAQHKHLIISSTSISQILSLIQSTIFIHTKPFHRSRRLLMLNKQIVLW